MQGKASEKKTVPAKSGNRWGVGCVWKKEGPEGGKEG